LEISETLSLFVCTRFSAIIFESERQTNRDCPFAAKAQYYDMDLDERTENAILSRAILPHAGSWPAAAARSLADIRLAEEDLARADDLAQKAVEGSLSGSEAEELKRYRHAGRVIEMLKAKAKICSDAEHQRT
jgi:hypothetical protein